MPHHLIRWVLTDGTLIGNVDALVKATVMHLRHTGIPVDRCFLGAIVPNPESAGVGIIYEQSGDSLREVEVSIKHFVEMKDENASPLGQLLSTGRNMRCLLGRGQDQGMADLKELRENGYTDYFGVPLKNAGRIVGAISYATREESGFTEDHERILNAIVPALTSVSQGIMQDQVNRTRLQTYLGADAGNRVHAGQLRRGEGQNLRAAILLADMRGYTKLSSECEPEVILDLLNAVLEIGVEQVQAAEGQVLKFLGDGYLAIFSNAPANVACDRALKAAQLTQQAVSILNEKRRKQGRPVLELGIGLHYGDVLYGNIGAPGRLDFTVIGQAVNLASRIEALCSKLQKRILTSDVFEATVESELESCGKHDLKGIPRAVEVFSG